MAIGDKPTEQPIWATDPGADLAEPSAAEKIRGWIFGRPNRFWMNWWQNLAYQWTAFVENYSENHVHDGGSADLSAPKVDFTDHIDYGTNGEMEIAEDTVSLHHIVHSSTTGADTRLTTDILVSSSRLIVGDTTNQQIRYFDGSGLPDAREARFESEGDADPVVVVGSAFRPLLSDTPGGDFATLAPRDETLFRENLCKGVFRATLTENAGAVVVVVDESFNVPGTLVGGATADAWDLALADTNAIDGAVEITVGRTPGSADTDIYMANAAYDGAGTIELRIWRWTGTNWTAVRVSPLASMDLQLTIEVK